MVDTPERDRTEKNKEVPVHEVVKSAEGELEMEDGLEDYVEKAEKAGEQVGPVPTDDSGQPLVQPSDSAATASNVTGDDWQLPDDAVVLPMTQDEFQVGIHEPIVRGARWLAEWCAYIIKKLGDKVFFRG